MDKTDIGVDFRSMPVVKENISADDHPYQNTQLDHGGHFSKHQGNDENPMAVKELKQSGPEKHGQNPKRNSNESGYCSARTSFSARELQSLKDESAPQEAVSVEIDLEDVNQQELKTRNKVEVPVYENTDFQSDEGSKATKQENEPQLQGKPEYENTRCGFSDTEEENAYEDSAIPLKASYTEQKQHMDDNNKAKVKPGDAQIAAFTVHDNSNTEMYILQEMDVKCTIPACNSSPVLNIAVIKHLHDIETTDLVNHNGQSLGLKPVSDIVEFRPYGQEFKDAITVQFPLKKTITRKEKTVLKLLYAKVTKDGRLCWDELVSNGDSNNREKYLIIGKYIYIIMKSFQDYLYVVAEGELLHAKNKSTIPNEAESIYLNCNNNNNSDEEEFLCCAELLACKTSKGILNVKIALSRRLSNKEGNQAEDGNAVIDTDEFYLQSDLGDVEARIKPMGNWKLIKASDRKVVKVENISDAPTEVEFDLELNDKDKSITDDLGLVQFDISITQKGKKKFICCFGGGMDSVLRTILKCNKLWAEIPNQTDRYQLRAFTNAAMEIVTEASEYEELFPSLVDAKLPEALPKQEPEAPTGQELPHQKEPLDIGPSTKVVHCRVATVYAENVHFQNVPSEVSYVRPEILPDSKACEMAMSSEFERFLRAIILPKISNSLLVRFQEVTHASHVLSPEEMIHILMLDTNFELLLSVSDLLEEAEPKDATARLLLLREIKKEKIRRMTDHMADVLIRQNIIEQLYQRGTFGPPQKEKLANITDNREMLLYLINEYILKGAEKCVDDFIDSLMECGHNDLVKLIMA